jgi:hypothetical protein
LEGLAVQLAPHDQLLAGLALVTEKGKSSLFIYIENVYQTATNQTKLFITDTQRNIIIFSMFINVPEYVEEKRNF